MKRTLARLVNVFVALFMAGMLVTLPAPQPVVAATLVDLVLVPATPMVAVGDTVDVTVEVQAGASGVDGITITMDYDPAYLEFQSWTLPAVNHFEELMFEATSVPGEADYARFTFAVPPTATGTFDFVTMTFKALAATASTPIDFQRDSPRETVALVGIENGLNTATGASVTIRSSSVSKTATPTELVSIAVTPADSSIALGLTQQLTAWGTYDDESIANITGDVTWASGNLSVATIDAAGLATGLAAGTTTITATLPMIDGITTLTVTGAGAGAEVEAEEAVALPTEAEPGVTDVSDVSDATDENGVIVEEVTVESENGEVELAVGEGTTTVKALPPKLINWWLIGGIIAGVVVIGVVIWLILRRRTA